MINIGIAEDHDLVREGLISLFEDEMNIMVAFDVSNGAELMTAIAKNAVDVILLDLEMPVVSGLEALKMINEDYPQIKVIILSMHYSDDFIKQGIREGARGFLPKNVSIETVIDAIHAVVSQGYYFDDNMPKEIIADLIKRNSIQPVFSNETLTERELEIVQLICDGMMNKEIADDLNISVRTVEAHRKSINIKTHASNTAGVVIYAIKNGLYTIDDN